MHKQLIMSVSALNLWTSFIMEAEYVYMIKEMHHIIHLYRVVCLIILTYFVRCIHLFLQVLCDAH